MSISGPLAHPSNSSGSGLAEIVRTVYLRRSTGWIEGVAGPRWIFQDGELFLERNHPRAAEADQAVKGLAAGVRPASDPILRSIALNLAKAMGDPRSNARFNGGREPLLTLDLVGPLPTLLVAMDLAVRDRDEDALVEALGGNDCQYRNTANSPALNQLPAPDPEMLEVMSRLENPVSVGQVVRGIHGGRAMALRGLAKLRALGLVEAVQRGAWREALKSQTIPSTQTASTPSPTPGPTLTEPSPAPAPKPNVTPRLFQVLSARISESLGSEPLLLPVDQHRARLADLLSRHGELDHYGLLGVDPETAEDEAVAAFRERARLVHPANALRLGLVGREQALEALFERLIESYLVLSDPKRRASYDLVSGVRLEPAVDPERRRAEKVELARRNFRLATHYMSPSVPDYPRAMGLLQESTRLDPRPEYFNILAQAEAKNSQWRDQAVESFHHAVASNPGDVEMRMSYATLLEGAGRIQEARGQYQAALELAPSLADARRALDRLGRGDVSDVGTKLAAGLATLLKS